VRDEVVPGAEWVVAGEGVATEKIDGTRCLWQDETLFKRYDAKHGKKPPAGFIPAQDPDPVTGHWPGWIRVGGGPEDRWHREGIASSLPLVNGCTYELVGPKVQSNPYKLDHHKLCFHGGIGFEYPPERTFAAIKFFLERHAIEGIVWHHPDGRMVKIKARDFGLQWPR
jgi:hypothetical protein